MPSPKQRQRELFAERFANKLKNTCLETINADDGDNELATFLESMRHNAQVVDALCSDRSNVATTVKVVMQHPTVQEALKRLVESAVDRVTYMNLNND